MASSGLPPANQAPPPPINLPDLNQCVAAIVESGNNQSSRGHFSTSVAMVGLSTLISVELRSAKDSSGGFPISETLAMREIITNPRLFQALLSMLSGHRIDSSPDTNRQGRKRSPSEDNTFPVRKKQMLATPPPNRHQPYPRQASQSQHNGTTHDSNQVFAATVLFSVLQHIDHWPINLMRAFATDTFGQRNWVDNELCNDLVLNLEMSLNQDASDAASSAFADEVESYFSSLTCSAESNGTGSSMSNRAAALSQQRIPSAKEVRTQSKQAAEAMDDDSSSSGEEEVEVDSPPQHRNTATIDLLNKLFQRSANSTRRVRSRYVGHNLDLAYEAISDALVERLSSKSKQNSRLLQALPMYLCIPRVRCLSSRHLDRWLQSPALAGLARNLLAQLTKTVSKADPPLPDDVEVIDNLLKMKLKTNQHSMHVENITMVAKRVPTAAVAKQVFLHSLIGDMNNEEEFAINPGHEQLEILRSVYSVLDSALAAESLASAVLELTSISPQHLHSRALRLVVSTLEDHFDAFLFTECIIKAKMGASTSISSSTNNARLIFECAMLSRPDSKTKDKMLCLRKSILRWCMTDLACVYHKKISQEEEDNTYDGTGSVTKGPVVYDFSSYLDPTTIEKKGSIYKFMTLTQCLLFLIPVTSENLTAFIRRDLDEYESECLNLCRQYREVDNEMLEIVLKSQHTTASTAISLIEGLILGCSNGQDFPISNDLIWKLYDLSKYTVEIQSKASGEGFNLPILAHSSLWWRVTAIALSLCGLSSSIGKFLWEEHPTLRALIKMTTAQKYRYPTADCDDAEKEIVRIEDGKVKECEAKIAEKLFTRPKPSETIDQNPIPQQLLAEENKSRRGLRSSTRQRVKRDRELALDQERIAAEKHAALLKLRRQLKTLQKSIMIWDPAQYQRKPPKESIDLILSINNSFNLAERFRASVAPDYLLQTIGDGRSAVERAYDWLIPFISNQSEVIHRLQPSSTCFLLLKAYGSDSNDKELIDLSAPLLSHVQKCLNGEYGEDDSAHALELLLTDVADGNADRRRCSRKVLQQAMPNDYGLCGWLRLLEDCSNAKMLIPVTTEYLSRALAYERGKVLSVYIKSLHRYNTFISEHQLQHKFDFVETLCRLIASRPHVCADAMINNSEALLLVQITRAFDEAVSEKDSSNNKEVFLRVPALDDKATCTTVWILSSLLRAAVVIVSNWEDHGDGQFNSNTTDEYFTRLLAYLIIPPDLGKKSISGLASALNEDDRTPAASIEDWASLARAKSSIVAKHIAQSAPDIFLPRLLLCCGMSELSFATMLRRLNDLSESSSDPNKIFQSSLASISRLGLTKIGSRRMAKRKLLGRIMAYTRTSHENLEHLHQSSFVSWLMSECELDKPKESRAVPPNKSWCLDNTCHDLSYNEEFPLLEDDVMASIDKYSFDKGDIQTCDSMDVLTEDFVRSCIDSECYEELEKSLQLREQAAMFKQSNDDSTYASTAAALLAVCSSCQQNDRVVCMLIKWVPRLFQMNQDLSYHTLFIDLMGKFSLHFDTCIRIVSNCAVQWPNGRILECKKWIAEQQTKNSWEGHLTRRLALKFLVLASEISLQLDKYASCLIDLSLDCCLHHKVQQPANGQYCLTSSNARDILPDWLALIMCIANEGSSFLNLTISRVMHYISENKSSTRAYSAVLLRLYTLHPSAVILTETNLKTVLLQGARDNITTWLSHNKCPLDAQIKAMIFNMSTSPHKSLLQSIIQLANQHPLLFMRHLDAIKQRLIEDGSAIGSNGQPLMKRGRIQGRLSELEADIEGQLIRVYVLCWGYSFNEPVWTCMLDLLLSIPPEVLFGIGVAVGLIEILNLYSKLFAIHVDELNEENNIIELRAKFDRLSSTFMKYNPERYQQFMKDRHTNSDSI